jgi:hypothetical protein
LFDAMPTKVKGAVNDFQTFFVQRREFLVSYMRYFLLLICPAIGIAFILYYFADNTPVGRVDWKATQAMNNGTKVNHRGQHINPMQASASWWILFICVRQAITFSLARGLQVFVIDFLCLSTRMMTRAFGNLVTLFIVQSKGWPFITFTWSLFNFALLHGSYRLADHWLYWQQPIGIFNETNPR